MPNRIGLRRRALAAELSRIGKLEKQVKMLAGQIWQWIYNRGVPSFEDMTNLSKDYRALLAAERRDAETAVRELRAASQKSLGHMVRFSADPRFEPISRDPVFHELIDEITGRWVEVSRSRGL